MDELLTALREKLEEPWKPVGAGGLGAVLACCLGLVLWMATARDPWIPLLDGANLLFHEVGHPLFGILGEGPGLYGGTLMQVLVPAAVALNFAWRREAVPTALALAWIGQNFVNIARYAADARIQALPLVGGGEHDWEGILLRWRALGYEGVVASTFRGVALTFFLAAAAWISWRFAQDRASA